MHFMIVYGDKFGGMYYEEKYNNDCSGPNEGRLHGDYRASVGRNT